jgi:anti-sigma28 factor (negative regulator of flagellin synthesis)
MRISGTEYEKVLRLEDLTPDGEALASAKTPVTTDDTELVAEIVAELEQMPDRDEIVADIKARVEAGTYKVSSDAIAELMMRRAKADNIR